MKNFAFLLLLSVLLIGCSGNQDKTTENDEVGTEELSTAPENLQEIRFDVGGMTCTGCENTVIKGISELEGIAEVTASFVDSIAVVTYDKTRATPEQMAEVIKKKGYEVLGQEVL